MKSRYKKRELAKTKPISMKQFLAQANELLKPSGKHYVSIQANILQYEDGRRKMSFTLLSSKLRLGINGDSPQDVLDKARTQLSTPIQPEDVLV